MLTPVEPRVRVTVASLERVSADKSHWSVAWTIHNDGSDPLELTDAWIPHGRFRGDGRIPVNVSLPPRASTTLEFRVAAAESPGTVVENAFLILRATQQHEAWRVFTRMRVEFDADSTPVPVLEAITYQALK
jgi:hypothetical protein